MAAGKKANKAKAKKIITEAQKKKIRATIKNAEEKLITNYRKIAGISGKDLAKAKVKVKKNMAKAKKRIEAAIRKNPAGAAVAAAAMGALVGALLMSKVKRK